jgi:hypothetical protein
MQDPVIRYDHAEIKQDLNLPWDQMTMISVWDIEKPFRFRILGNALRLNKNQIKKVSIM